MLAAALITLMCLGENNARNSPLLTSLVIDMDKQTVAGDGIGCHNNQPCPITQVTESYIRFKVSSSAIVRDGNCVSEWRTFLMRNELQQCTQCSICETCVGSP
jgi:hypothetical protein